MIRRIGSVLLLLVVVAPAAGVHAQPQERTLVVPFDNVKRDGTIFWLTEAAAVLLTDDLNALGANAIERTERQQAFERLQVPPVVTLTDATVIRVGQIVGATRVVVGSLQREGDTLMVRARSIALETGRMQFDVTERGPLPELFATFERIARRLVPGARQSSEEIERLHPPLAVFEDFIKGLLAETPATAASYLNAALQRQPSFDRARLALWDAYAEEGDYERALAAVQPIADGAPYGRRARFLAGLAQVNLEKYADAFATFKALADAHPTPTALNNLGVVQLRRGSTLQTGVPTFYFNKAVEQDPADPDYTFNLGYAYWMDRDPQAAIYWLRESVRRNPADGDAHFVLAAALASAGRESEAVRERELAHRLSSAYELREKKTRGADVVPRGLERLKNEVELPHSAIETRLASSEQRSQEELAQFHLERARRLFQQENDRDAVSELNRALYLSPYHAEAHLLLGRIHLRNSRIADAIEAFKISVWSSETATAHVALGEALRQNKEFAAARAEADRALALDPASAEAKQLLARLTQP
jgi:tetratricopeptide (TPR) repeat protein